MTSIRSQPRVVLAPIVLLTARALRSQRPHVAGCWGAGYCAARIHDHHLLRQKCRVQLFLQRRHRWPWTQKRANEFFTTADPNDQGGS